MAAPMVVKVVSAAQMRRIEDRSEALSPFPVSKDTLMENAGLEVARSVRRRLGHLPGVRVVMLVGPGNNGGDGLVAARHLHRWGARVLAYLCGRRPSPDPKLDALRETEMLIVRATDDEGLALLREWLALAHAAVDSVLGTGRSRPIEGALASILAEVSRERSSRADLALFAVDVPTGLDADSGAVDPLTPRPDVTLALGYPKLGMFALPGCRELGRAGGAGHRHTGRPGRRRACGVDDRGHRPRSWLPPSRPLAAHKGSFGRALVVAGSPNYVGAARLAASAATRAGAGLVTLAIPAGLQSSVASGTTEPTFIPLPESTPGFAEPERAAAMLLEAIDGYDSLLVGCGLGQDERTRGLLERLLLGGEPLPPSVVDADALNFLASRGDAWSDSLTSGAVLTPHPGEMSRLLGEPTTRLQADRVATATNAAAAWGKVVALKGAFTVVAAPDGRATLSPFANPGLASAGTGDVLAGAIAGLLAQGVGLFDAATLGVYLHGAAGERVRAELGDAGMVASDLLPELPRAIRALAGRRG